MYIYIHIYIYIYIYIYIIHIYTHTRKWTLTAGDIAGDVRHQRLCLYQHRLRLFFFCFISTDSARFFFISTDSACFFFKSALTPPCLCARVSSVGFGV